MNLFVCEVDKNVAFTQPLKGVIDLIICTSLLKAELHNIDIKLSTSFESTFLEHYIMSANYPDDYPNNYDQVTLKFPCFPHDA